MKKKNERKRFNKNKLIIAIAVIIGILALFGASYYLLGMELSLILFIGLGLTILLGLFLDKSRTKKKKRKVLKIIFMILLILGILGLLAATVFIGYIVKKAPDFDSEMLKEKQSTIIYDSHGNEMAKLGTEVRENIEYNQVSEVLIDAIIATEDSRFFQHNGFDLMRFTKAALGQLAGNSDAGGGSTLTMQVVKNTFTDATADSGIEGIIRKFTDIYISIFQLEKNYTKEAIIEFYINNHYLGGVYGVQEASQYYFGKNANELNLSEAALIAGLFKSPKYYNPYNYPENAESRRNIVLYLMERHGYITNEERKMAASIPIESLLDSSDMSGSEYQGYIDTVTAEVKERYGVNPETTPLLIYTNMIKSKQDAINKIMNNDNYSWWKDHLTQGSVVVLNSHSGKIEAIGTGRHRSGKNNWNYATSDTGFSRQIGSTAKPLFDYAPGMEYNNWSTYTLFDDEKGYTYSDGTPIKNYDNDWEGVITLRRALSDSRNIPALKAFQQVDNKKIIDLVTSVGITPEISNGYIHEAHCIGAFTGSDPLTMAGAYQIFSNGGYYYEPYSVNKIVFRTTGEEDTYSSPKQKIISDSTAYMITDILKGAVTYTQKQGLNKDIMAAKSGTTNLDSKTAGKLGISDFVRDYWVIGYTNDTVISLWLGYDDLSNKYKFKYSTDNNLRFKFFNTVAKSCFNHNGKDFTRPNSVISSKVEKLSDPPMLPSANTPKDQILTELFKKGTEPTEVSTKYMKLNTPTNFTVNQNSNSVSLSWSPVTDLGYVENGVLGYYVYFNNEEIGFTSDTYYTITGLPSYIGTYSVKAGYHNTTNSLSDPVTYTLEAKKDYDLYINGSKITNYKIGDSIDAKFYNGSLVKLLENGTDVTSSATITIKITDINGTEYSTIPTDKEGNYKVTYTVTYNSYTNTCYNEIKIEDR